MEIGDHNEKAEHPPLSTPHGSPETRPPLAALSQNTVVKRQRSHDAACAWAKRCAVVLTDATTGTDHLTVSVFEESSAEPRTVPDSPAAVKVGSRGGHTSAELVLSRLGAMRVSPSGWPRAQSRRCTSRETNEL